MCHASVSLFFHCQSNQRCFSKQITMADCNEEVEAFMSGHNEAVETRPHMWHHIARNTSNLFCNNLLKRLKRILQKQRIPIL